LRTITFRPTWEAWLRHASAALVDGIPPSEIVWAPDEPDAQTALPFGGPTSSRPKAAAPVLAGSPAVCAAGEVPCDFERLGRLVACHRSEDRFGLLYRLLWRARHGEPEVLGDMLDPEVFRFRRMAAAVREDLKGTRSHLRLRDPGYSPRRTTRSAPDGRLPDLVAWCDPRHRILPLLAEELAARSPGRSFALLSPRASAFWDGRTLDLGPGASAAGTSSKGELAARWETRHRVAA
jgi:DNA polymerase